jgi:putative peptide zinc metalloprotease protein
LKETTLATTDEQQTTVPQPAEGAHDGGPQHDGRPPDDDRRASQDGAAPRLAEGIELIGRYEDSGYKNPPYIARRADGQVIQMPDLLYFVAEELDGQRGYDQIAERVSEKLGKQIAPDDAKMLVEQKLRPLGVVAGPQGEQPQLQKLDPMLALKLRTAVVPKSVVRGLTSIFYPFFYPPVMVAVLAGLVAVDVWLFFSHGVGQPAREIAYNPVLLAMVLGLVVLATALHEIGHATATRYGGAEPGEMGVGIYVVWPAFYTDVTDAYRLKRGGRLRVDLGGVYFNVVFILAVAGAYFLTGWEPLLILIPIQHFQILQQFLPFLRLDGYYILSDLVGVPDLFARIKPTLKSALPGEETDPAAAQLKGWVRLVTTLWIALLIPVLAFTFGLMIFNLPRMIATAWDSFFVQLDKVEHGSGFGRYFGVVQLIAITLPIAGFAYTMTRGTGRLMSSAWSWSEGAPLRRAVIVAFTVLTAGVAGWVLLPNGDYRPIQPGERGTLKGGLQQFKSIQSGRPGLTEQRQKELGGAPAQKDLPGVSDNQEQLPGQTTSTPTATTPTGTTSTTPTDTTTTTTTTTTTP